MSPSNSVPPPLLPMSSLIAPDAPLLSPVESTWPIYSPSVESFPALPTYTYTAQDNCSVLSPVEVLKVTKQESAQPCLPTHQLFDLQQLQQQQQVQQLLPAPSQQVPLPDADTLDVAVIAPKRSSSPPALVPKKRVVGERISTKDFVPPDVSGLSKREARLVKNRAAAFLSRQRKREEFEAMEVRVGELERENARLTAIAQQSTTTTGSGQQFFSEIERLKAELAAAQNRERELNAELVAKGSASPVVKQEIVDSDAYLLNTKPPTSSHKSAASLGLMVLLCALPSLLSMPTTHHQQSSASFPTTFGLPHSLSSNSAGSAAAFDINSYFGGGGSNEFSEWASRNFETDDGTGSMLLSLSPPPPSLSRKTLEFSNIDTNSILNGLDISFDASPSEDGKIRVRIHNPSSSGASSRAPSPAASSSSYQGPWELTSSSDSDPGLSFSDQSGSPSPSYNDPFMGVGGNPSSPVFSSLVPTFSSSSYASSDQMDYGSDFGSFGSEYGGSNAMNSGTKRRVRIALKTMPSAEGPEGGEWEVQFC